MKHPKIFTELIKTTLHLNYFYLPSLVQPFSQILQASIEKILQALVEKWLLLIKIQGSLVFKLNTLILEVWLYIALMCWCIIREWKWWLILGAAWPRISQNLISPLLSTPHSGLSVVPVCCVIGVWSVCTTASELWPHTMPVSVFIYNKGLCSVFIENTET